jgi:tripartite-type tricarboxylate transporter receptor subunit TctC
MKVVCVSLAFAMAACGASPPAAAQDVAGFYRGKTLTVVVGSGAGGGYDVLARTAAPYLTKHLPGNPNVIVQNMVGAGGIVAANYLFTVAPKDGAMIGMPNNTVPFEPLMGTAEATFDARQMNWLGTPSVEVGLVAIWHTSPVQTLDDLRKRETNFGASAYNSTPGFYSRLLNETLGTKIHLVLGYPGQAEVFFAMEKGEVEGFPSTFYSALTSTRSDWLRDKKVNLVLQYGLSKHPDLPDIPFANDLVSKPEDKALLDLAFAALAIGRPFVAPPGVPADRVAALRAALAAAFRDEGFRADAEKLRLSVDQPRTGEQLADRIAEAYRASPELIARLRRLAGR